MKKIIVHETSGFGPKGEWLTGYNVEIIDVKETPMNQDNLVKSGVREFSAGIPGTLNKIVVTIRWTDVRKNGYNTFSITGEIIDTKKDRGILCGAIHHELSAHFPELQKYFKWHLMSAGGLNALLPERMEEFEADLAELGFAF